VTNPNISTLCDHFDQGSVNSNLWTTPSGASLASVGTGNVATTLSMSPSFAGISFPVTVTVPTLTCTATSGNNEGVQSVAAYDLTGGGLSVELLPFTPGNNVQCDFSLITGVNSLSWHVDNSGNLDVVDTVNGTTRVKNSPITSAYRYLRIRESGGTTYWDYSADGLTWTNAVNVSNPFSVTGVTVFLGTTGSPSGTNTVLWANVNYVL